MIKYSEDGSDVMHMLASKERESVPSDNNEIEAANKPWQRSEALAVGPDYDAMKGRLSSIMSSAACAGVEPPRGDRGIQSHSGSVL
jgi:hypothetical protein